LKVASSLPIAVGFLKKKRVGPKRAGTWLTEEAEAILPFILTYFVDIQLGHSNAYCSIQPYETSLAAMVVVGGDCSKTQTPSLLFLRSRQASSLICSGNCNFFVAVEFFSYVGLFILLFF
jgi:hypothetical protein